MTRYAAFQRDAACMRSIQQANSACLRRMIPADLRDDALLVRLRLRDLLLTQREVLSAMQLSLEHDDGEGVLMTRNGHSAREEARPLPTRELWFERVWQAYRAQQES